MFSSPSLAQVYRFPGPYVPIYVFNSHCNFITIILWTTSIPFSVPFLVHWRRDRQVRKVGSPKPVVVCGHRLATLSLTINKTVKWLSSLPILVQESFWWWQCSVRYSLSFPQLHGISVLASTSSALNQFNKPTKGRRPNSLADIRLCSHVF